MRKGFLALAMVAALAGCGYSHIGGDTVGQAKGLTRTTNLVCSDYFVFDLSLGVMRNGTGSMSKQDMLFTVAPNVDVVALRDAVKRSAIVKPSFHTRRAALCTEDYILTSFEVLE